MSITVGDLRRMIDGLPGEAPLPDDIPILTILCLGDYTDEPIDIRLTEATRGSHGEPRIEITVEYIDEEGDEEDDELDDDPSWRCDRCGCPLDGDEASVGLCDTCELDDEE